MAKKQKSIDRIISSYMRINMVVKMPELLGKSEKTDAMELLKEADYAIRALLDLRSVILYAVDMEQDATDAARDWVEQHAPVDNETA